MSEGGYFISYTHSEPDESLAHTLAHSLKVAGVTVFIDSDMRVGTDWSDEISLQIDLCDCFVVLVSEATQTSEMVQAEVRLASQRRKREGKPKLLPIRVRFHGRLDYELNAYLGQIQYVKWEEETDTERVLRELLNLQDGYSSTLETAQSFGGEADNLVDNGNPKPTVDPYSLLAPGGSIRVEDRFYIRRSADAIIEQRAENEGETVVIKGPRQMGKSSLLLRYLAKCKSGGKRFVLLDFSLFSSDELDSYSSLLAEIALFVARELKLVLPGVPQMTNQRALTFFMEDTVFPAISEGIVIAFDEVDRVLGRSYHKDFFSMLRMWHNKRAQPDSLWERLDLALVVSTELSLLIDDADRSPFNVSQPIELSSFSFEECCRLNERYGYPLDQKDVERLYELLGGHPYLTRLAFYKIVASERIPFLSILANAADPYGPFGDHLRAWLFKIRDRTELITGLKQIISTGTAPSDEISYRLHGAGLVQHSDNQVRPSNLLYYQFFKSVL